MSFEKRPLTGPPTIEHALEPIEIPRRFNINPDPEMQKDLRYALELCDERIAGEKYNQERLPSMEIRYRKSILNYLLKFEAIELDDLHEALIEEYKEIKESAYQKALEFVYRMNR